MNCYTLSIRRNQIKIQRSVHQDNMNRKNVSTSTYGLSHVPNGETSKGRIAEEEKKRGINSDEMDLRRNTRRKKFTYSAKASTHRGLVGTAEQQRIMTVNTSTRKKTRKIKDELLKINTSKKRKLTQVYDGGISRLDELGCLLSGLAGTAVHLLLDLVEFAGNVGGMAVQHGRVSVPDLSGMVENNHLRRKRKNSSPVN